MLDDFLACLTREIKDEVMEQYVSTRRVTELQIEHLFEQAEEVHGCARQVAKRLARLGYREIPLPRKKFHGQGTGFG